MTQEFIHTIFARRSIRSYTAEPVSEQHIKTLLETAMAAPSASNMKPWHFVVVTDRHTLDRLAELLVSNHIPKATQAVAPAILNKINPTFKAIKVSNPAKAISPINKNELLIKLPSSVVPTSSQFPPAV